LPLIQSTNHKLGFTYPWGKILKKFSTLNFAQKKEDLKLKIYITAKYLDGPVLQFELNYFFNLQLKWKECCNGHQRLSKVHYSNL
jgi:hypothetical protein